MKASSILSLATMAVSAMAAPVLDTVTGATKKVTNVGDATGTVSQLTGGLPVANGVLDQVSAEKLLASLPTGAALEEIVAKLPTDGAGVVDKMGAQKTKATDAESVVVVIQDAVNKVKQSTSTIQSTMSKVQSGEMEKAEGDAQVVDLIEGINLDLTEIVTSLTGQAGIPVSATDVDRVLVLVDILVKELLVTVNTIVTVLGLRPQLISLLHSVFTLVANILTILIALLGGLLPGLVGGLSPLLAGLGNGVLAPILTPVVALVAGIAGV